MTNFTQQEALMKQKETGSHFTPTGLADLIAKRLIHELNQENKPKDQELTILDPSCGDGELLVSADRIASLHAFANLRLIGIDEDEEAVRNASTRLNQAGFSNHEIFQSDFLELVDLEAEPTLFQEPAQRIDPVDVIIANPPYVRTQILGAERTQKLAKLFGLKGRVDLYHAFIVAMTLQLKPGGLMGVITSNRYLTTKGGESIRKFFVENFEIIEIVDLGDTKLFSAAVLPAIFIGRKKEKNVKQEEPVNFYRIYESGLTSEKASVTAMNSIYEVLESDHSGTYKVNDRNYSMSVGKMIIPADPKEPWSMATEEEFEWVSAVKQHAFCKVEDLFHVKVGIKTTADNVFIRENWNELPPEDVPEAEILQPLLSTEHAGKWRPLERIPEQQILYTHEMAEGKKQVIDFAAFPKSLSYLEKHRQQLESRTYVIKAKRKWFEIWVPQSPDLLKSKKVVFPDIGIGPKFYLEDNGCFVDGNCYWIVPKDRQNEELLYLILGIANTRYMTVYHDIAFQNKLYAGRRRYLTQYVSKYPVPDPRSEAAQEIIKRVKTLVYEALEASEVKRIEEEIENLTASAFRLEALQAPT